jgi:hypothetical protein
MKPIGTGVNLWPSTPVTYPYTTKCTNLDALKTWWAKSSNLNAFAHVSHTFTHEDQDNATYFDVFQEMTWNQAWLKQVGIAAATRYSPLGLIPPAITGLHNGDAIRAWIASGVTHVVGDNTRPVLLNTVNEMWPLMSTVASNGYAGVQITPRWATNIYYNVNSHYLSLQWPHANICSANFPLAQFLNGLIPIHRNPLVTGTICWPSKRQQTQDICSGSTTTPSCSIKQT